ncbi:hypothetical protein LH51_07670 [Nitrincola sp. A-D6]|uniref:O-antigen ligase family protein n=1 Tax=Nitrincola sp. A-D6 TaxID=1545442 RepID=UPI00051FD841|nr:O-antigen ligase family protein [Nitrincola sp. A-D6]KGK42389.1 hypothetical protein LH51_07670 [Nitrincola sp. A-D6]
MNEIFQGNLDTSIGLRLQMWDVALRAGSENWLFGIGKSDEKRRDITSAIIHDKNYDSGLMYQHHNFHNDILDHFFKYGLIGVLLLIFVFVAPIVGLNRKWRIYMLTILIVFIFAGLTVNFFEHRRAFVIYFILVAILRYLSTDEGGRSETIQ